MARPPGAAYRLVSIAAAASADNDAPPARGGRPQRELLAPLGVGAAAFVAFMTFAARYPTEWDSVQLTLGVRRFDVTQDSPHPPGYWLYVASGRAVRALTGLNAQRSLQVVAALAGAVAVAVVYLIGRRIGGAWLGWATALFLLTSPYLLFYSSIVSSSAFDALACAILLVLVWDARAGSAHAVAAAIVLGLGAGFRQSMVVMFAPLVAMAVVRCVRSLRAAIAVVVAGAASVLLWLVPMMLDQPGGLARYRGYSSAYTGPTLKTTSPLFGSTRQAFVNNIGQATAYTLAAVALLVPVLVIALFLQRARSVRNPVPAVRFLLFALTAPAAVVLLVQYGRPGYVLAYLPVLALLLLLPAARLRGRRQAVATVLVGFVCLANAQRFLGAPGILPLSVLNEESAWFTQERHGAPFRVTRQEIQKVDRSTVAYLALARRYDAARDVLVYIAENGGYRFREASYTLPQFRTVYGYHGFDVMESHRLHVRRPNGHDSVVPAGGRVVFVLDVVFPEMEPLLADGRLRAVDLDTGPRVYESGPDVDLFGVQFRTAGA